MSGHPRSHALEGRLSVNNVAIAVEDLAGSTAWYERVLGFKAVERGSFEAVGASYVMLEGAGTRIELITRPGAKVLVDRTTPPDHLGVLGLKALVLQSEDLASVTAHLIDSGAEIVWAELQLSADRRSTLIRDAEGNLINIFGAIAVDTAKEA